MSFNAYTGYALGVVAVGGLSRLWVQYRRRLLAKKAHQIPLFDGALLEAACTPRSADNDDPSVLAEFRETFAHLNRQAYAEEVWGLNKQLAEYYAKLPVVSRPTMRRALLRLLLANDRWLQIIAAKTCADLSLPEAVAPLRAIAELGESMTYSETKYALDSAQKAETLFRQEIEKSLGRLE